MATTITAGNATNGGAAVSSDNTGILELKTGTGAGTTALTVDTSQNVGLGVTPDNWSGLASNVFQTYAFAIAPLGANAVDYTQNAVGNGSGAYKYRSSFAASMYRQINSQHQWFNAPSGTAGNAITFTQAMTLDASGNLGIGTTSPAQRLSVIGNIALGTDSTNQSARIQVADASAQATDARFLFRNGTDTNAALRLVLNSANAVSMDAVQANNSATTKDLLLQVNGGNVGIGATSASNALVIQRGAGVAAFIDLVGNGNTAGTSNVVLGQNNDDGGYFWNRKSSFLSFGTNNTERARITSGGVLVVGGTAASGFSEVINCVGRFVMSEGTQNISLSNGAILINGSTNNYLNGAYISVDTSNNFSICSRVSNTDTERIRMNPSGITQFLGNIVMPYQGAPTSKAAAATLTGAELITGILNTTGTTYTITLPTGTNIEGALTWSANNVSLDWYVINTASGTITIGANGNTTLGSLTIATGTSAHFRIRRTAANTFTVYRL